MIREEKITCVITLSLVLIKRLQCSRFVIKDLRSPNTLMNTIFDLKKKQTLTLCVRYQFKSYSVLRFFPRTVVCCPMLSQNPYGMNNNKIKFISIEYIITLKIRVKTSNRCINPHTRSLTHLHRKFSFSCIFFQLNRQL